MSRTPDLPERTDVLVIGGGIAGSSVLHNLARAGVKGLLVDRGQAGEGATSAAAGVLAPPVRQPFHETVRDRGLERAREIWAFAQRSVEGLAAALEGMGAAEEAELDLRGGHVLAEPHTESEVRDACRALAEAGFPVEWLESNQVQEVTGGHGFLGGFRLAGTGSVNARNATRALIRDATRLGATAVEGVNVREVVRRDGGLVASHEDGEIRASMVVYATHTDSRRFSALVGDEIVPIRGQGLRVRISGIPEPRGSFSTHWKMNVWRGCADGTLAVSGWRHNAWDRSYWKSRPELDDRLQSDLEAWLGITFPEAAVEVLGRWSGIFGWTSDYLPLVGPLPGSPDEMVVCGFSGGGLPFAWESGRILASAIAGGTTPEGASMFNPRRFI